MERLSIFIHAYICTLLAYLATSAQMKPQCVTCTWERTHSFNILIFKAIQKSKCQVSASVVSFFSMKDLSVKSRSNLSSYAIYFLFYLNGLFIFIFIFGAALPVCMPVYRVQASWPRKQEKGLISPETGITNRECSELNLGPMKENPVLLTTESSHYPST